MLMPGVVVRRAMEAEASTASELVHASFKALAARDWESKAQEFFLADSLREGMARKINSAAYAAGAFAVERMVGFILMPAPSLLGMLFVHPQWLRQGVATTLWESARAHVEAEFPAVKTVELNSTPFAVEFYRAIGFVPISTEFRRDGARATRMACWLPARSLGAEMASGRSGSGPGAA